MHTRRGRYRNNREGGKVKEAKFNFTEGEFEMTPTGKVKLVEDTEAWRVWCQKALLTERYYYLVYDHDFGQEFEELIGSSLPKEIIEMEIERIVKETLAQHAYTKGVGNFTFEWVEDECYFTCEVESINGENITLEGVINANT